MRAGSLEVRVGAPPVDGAANDELLTLVAERLGLPRRAVTLHSGAQGRTKRLRVEGVTAAEARARLGLAG